MAFSSRANSDTPGFNLGQLGQMRTAPDRAPARSLVEGYHDFLHNGVLTDG